MHPFALATSAPFTTCPSRFDTVERAELSLDNLVTWMRGEEGETASYLGPPVSPQTLGSWKAFFATDAGRN